VFSLFVPSSFLPRLRPSVGSSFVLNSIQDLSVAAPHCVVSHCPRRPLCGRINLLRTNYQRVTHRATPPPPPPRQIRRASREIGDCNSASFGRGQTKRGCAVSRIIEESPVQQNGFSPPPPLPLPLYNGKRSSGEFTRCKTRSGISRFT